MLIPPLPPQLLARADGEDAARHDGGAMGQRVRFLHAVRGEQDAPAGRHGRERLPHDAFARRVQAAARFVEQEDGRVAGHGDGQREFALRPSRQLPRELVPVGFEAAVGDELLDVVGRVGDAADLGVESEVFLHGEDVGGVELGADAQAGAGGGAVGEDGEVRDSDAGEEG